MQATADRAAAENMLGTLRNNLNAWRAQESERSPVVAALLWSQNEKWSVRIESLATQLEAHVGTLRTQEVGLTSALSSLPAEPPPAPPAPPPKKRARPR